MKALIMLGLFVGQMLTGNYRKLAGLPNFGNTVAEGTAVSLTAFFTNGSYFTAPATGTYVTFHAYCEYANGTNTSYFGVYPAPGGNASGQTLVAQGTFSCPSGAFGWATGSISAPVTAGSQYLLAVATAGTTDFAATNSTVTFASSGGAPLPTTAPTFTNQSGVMSLYLSKP